jgi:hypothetical protein
MLTKQQLKDRLDDSQAMTTGLIELVKKLRLKVQNQRKALRGLQRRNNELKENTTLSISFLKKCQEDGNGSALSRLEGDLMMGAADSFYKAREEAKKATIRRRNEVDQGKKAVEVAVERRIMDERRDENDPHNTVRFNWFTGLEPAGWRQRKGDRRAKNNDEKYTSRQVRFFRDDSFTGLEPDEWIQREGDRRAKNNDGKDPGKDPGKDLEREWVQMQKGVESAMSFLGWIKTPGRDLEREWVQMQKGGESAMSFLDWIKTSELCPAEGDSAVDLSPRPVAERRVTVERRTATDSWDTRNGGRKTK